MQESGVRVDCTELKTQLSRLRVKEINPGEPSSSAGDYLKVGFNFYSSPSPTPPKHPHIKIPKQTLTTGTPNGANLLQSFFMV